MSTSKSTPSNQVVVEGQDLRDYLNDKRGQEQLVPGEVQSLQEEIEKLQRK